jgi:serine/threonine protein kinase
VKLGRYEVVRELGKGAMGVVYLAKDPLIGRLVALKTIRPAAHADDDETKEFQQRFIREAQAAGILNHPSIVTVHDIGQDENGTSFIAMEYVEGQNLKEMLSQGRIMSFEQIGEIVAQVADALDFAHSKGIVHRDVKPANIILVDGNRAKIMDFGIAKISSGGSLTTTGQFLGTPNYMAPEQIKGAPVDGRTDIFSLGICLYECLTRRKPFGGDSLTTISYRIVHEPFPPLREVNPQIPEGFEEIAATCLAKDPAKRYQRGRDLAIALRAVLRGEKPPKAETILTDDTVVTRERERMPTVEVPFPEAEETPQPVTAHSDTIPSGRSPMAVPFPAAAATAPELEPMPEPPPPVMPPPPMPYVVPPPPPPRPRTPAPPIWKARIPPPIFIGIVVIILFAVVAALAAVNAKKVKVPVVNTAAEGKAMKERQLRVSGEQLLHQGRVDDAWTKFDQLQKLAPRSPYVQTRLRQLALVRQQQELTKQQLATAQQKFDQGMELFRKEQYGDSVPFFDAAFHLNPSWDDAARYLKLAQQEDEKQREEKARKAQERQQQKLAQQQNQQKTTKPPVKTPVTPQPVNNTPAQVTTVFTNGSLADGYIKVTAGNQTIAYENLYDESRFFHRRSPRSVSVTKQVPPMNTDIEIWVVVPNQKISEHKLLRANLEPGSSHRVMVGYDPNTKKFEYQLN